MNLYLLKIYYCINLLLLHVFVHHWIDKIPNFQFPIHYKQVFQDNCYHYIHLNICILEKNSMNHLGSILFRIFNDDNH